MKNSQMIVMNPILLMLVFAVNVKVHLDHYGCAGR